MFRYHKIIFEKKNIIFKIFFDTFFGSLFSMFFLLFYIRKKFQYSKDFFFKILKYGNFQNIR